MCVCVCACVCVRVCVCVCVAVSVSLYPIPYLNTVWQKSDFKFSRFELTAFTFLTQGNLLR